MPDWRAHLLSVRLRIALLATVAVLAGLAVAAFLLVRSQRDTLTDNIDTAIRVRADDITGLVTTGNLPSSLEQPARQISAVQVLGPSGDVVAATTNLAGQPPISDLRPPAGETDVVEVRGLPFDDERFHILARTVEAPGGPYTVLVAGSLEPVDDAVDSLVTNLWFGAPVVVLAVAAGAWFIVGRALAPVEAIRREAESITPGELSRRVPQPAFRDEVGRLARTLNEMLARIQEAHERQQRFVADASHELRSPLASLRTQLEVELAEAGDAAWRKTAANLLHEVIRMQRLVEDLLLLARGDAAPLVAGGLVDLDDVVLREARRDGRRHPGVRIDTATVSAGQVRGDPEQLARVVRNLLDNALNYAQSRVRLSLRETNGSVELAVDDDGPGIPEADRERIFERFTRLDAARGRSRGGAGLGLAITRAIVESHGGTVAVDPEYKSGARFVVKMPRAG